MRKRFRVDKILLFRKISLKFKEYVIF